MGYAVWTEEDDDPIKDFDFALMMIKMRVIFDNWG